MQINSTSIGLFVTVVGSFLGMLAFKDDQPASSMLYATCLALFVSSIFFAATVIAPETRRRHRIRRGLRKQYRSFKRRCVDLFLISSKSQDYQDRNNLLDHQEFRRYFSIRGDNDQSRWGLVITSIDDQDYIFDEIVRELDFLSREIDFARSSVDIDDLAVEDFLINLSQVIHTIKAAEANSDDYKHFSRTLWSIFTRWNFIDGQLEEDIIESMIERI
ncbi:hypothetical protein [Methylophaga sp.]|uniref:hypothetical protein n=1 Tax=Methylophaga sp. TaxID=2024840 RepID=UPI002717ABE3|nr:hypothetical protein [Methylophaga sp.]MDO8827252.1 hypothetical protein [Methylophaga sp.]